MAPSELLVLIKLLKAEGVEEYKDSVVHLRFSGKSGSGSEGSVQHPQAVSAEAKAEAGPHAEAAEVIPERLKKLNPNYRKLIEVSTRG